MRDDSRAELGRLIREELEGSGRGPGDVTRGWSLSAIRSFYGWQNGETIPLRKSRAMLEDALGWRRGTVTDILDAPITKTFTLSEVRDWSAQSEPAVVRARDLSTDELLLELTRRVGQLQEEVDALRGEGSNVVPLRKETRDMFDVAASSTAAGRNMEHLEGEPEG